MKNEFDYLNDIKMDFSDYKITELTDLECKKMKNVIRGNRTLKWGKVASVAACLAVMAVFSQTAFAQSLINNVVKSISTGFNHFVQVDGNNIDIKIPEELQGKLFDKNGVPLTTYHSGDVAYTKDGEMILNVGKYAVEQFDVGINGDKNSQVSIKISDKKMDDPITMGSSDECLVLKEEKEVQGYLNFVPELPAYLPKDFSFYGAILYKNGDGMVSGDYVTVYYKNQMTGKWFAVMERILNKDTVFTASTDGMIEEAKINGHTAVLQDGKSLHWEVGSIAVGISGRDVLTKDELFKVAESIQ